MNRAYFSSAPDNLTQRRPHRCGTRRSAIISHRDATTDRQWTQTLRNWNSRYRVYIHIDLDIIDPTQFDANDYSVSSGVSVEWLETAVSTIRRTFAVEGIGFTSYDPARDPERRAGQIVNRLIRAVLG
jgi:arginase family enzyme